MGRRCGDAVARSAGAADLVFAAGEARRMGRKFHPKVEYSIHRGHRNDFFELLRFGQGSKGVRKRSASEAAPASAVQAEDAVAKS